jgi:tripartite-type tricarboxylate transporter receptor subunit TctC
MNKGRRSFSVALATVPWMLIGPAADAQTSAWPNRSIRLVVPYPPGGASDISGRMQAEVLTKTLGASVVVDNRTGAGGTIGTAFVAKASPDGYTVMMASPSSHLGAPLLFRAAGYEGVDDFTAIATFSQGTAVVCVNNALPIKNIQDLIAYAKANPGKLNFGSAGAGGANHMLGVLFMQRTGTELTHVPYRGAAQALVDLIAGNIQVVFDSYSGIIGAIRSGQVRALGVTSAARWPLAPEMPTVQEQGVANFNLPSFAAVMGPANMPADIVQRMNTGINDGLKDPSVAQRLTAAGNIPYPTSPQEFAALMRSQREIWRELVRVSGVQPT